MCSGIGAPRRAGDEAGEAPLGPDERHGTRPPMRTAWLAVTAPGETTLTGPSNRRGRGHDTAVAASWSSITEKAGSASRLTGTTGRRSSRPRGLGTCGPTTGARRTAVSDTSAAARGLPPDLLGLEERAAEGGGRDRAGRTRPGGSPRPGGGRRRRCRTGPRRARATGTRRRPRARRWRPSAVHSAASPGWARALGSQTATCTTTWGSKSRTMRTILRRSRRLDPVEGGRAQAAPGRVDVEPGDLARPPLLLEQRGDERAQLAPHAAHQDALSAAHRAVTVARDLSAAAVRASSGDGLELGHPDRAVGGDGHRRHGPAAASWRAVPGHRPLDTHRQLVRAAPRGDVRRVAVGVGAGRRLRVVGDTGW